jgi:site-specific DNA recombinase
MTVTVRPARENHQLFSGLWKFEQGQHSASQIQIDPALIERFGRTMCENFRTGSVAFRKTYLRSLIDVIEVDDHQIRIKGSKDLLEKAVLASQNDSLECSQVSTGWRARQDSNL